MAGVDDLVSGAGAANRWAKAEKYAQGYADHGMGEALRIYYTRYFPLITVAVLLIAIMIAFLSAHGGPMDWWFTTRLGILLGAIGSFIGGFIYNAKRLKPSVDLGSGPSLIMALEKDEQQALIRGVDGRQSVPDEHLTIARALAVQWRKNNATMLLTIPAYFCIFALAFSTSTSSWYYLGMLIFPVTMLVLLVRSFHRHGRFLATTAPRTSPKLG